MLVPSVEPKFYTSISKKNHMKELLNFMLLPVLNPSFIHPLKKTYMEEFVEFNVLSPCWTQIVYIHLKKLIWRNSLNLTLLPCVEPKFYTSIYFLIHMDEFVELNTPSVLGWTQVLYIHFIFLVRTKSSCHFKVLKLGGTPVS